MSLEIEIKMYLKFALENGFDILKSEDLGMAKYCQLKYPILLLEIWNDRFDYSSAIEYNNEKYNTIHLANFITKTKKYEFYEFGFETREIDAKRFLLQLDKIIEIELDNILNFFFNLTIEDKTAFDKYCEETNAELRGW